MMSDQFRFAVLALCLVIMGFVIEVSRFPGGEALIGGALIFLGIVLGMRYRELRDAALRGDWRKTLEIVDRDGNPVSKPKGK